MKTITTFEEAQRQHDNKEEPPIIWPEDIDEWQPEGEAVVLGMNVKIKEGSNGKMRDFTRS